MAEDELQNRIRYQVNCFIFDNGFAPTDAQLSSVLELDIKEIQKGLTALVNNHAIVLHPNSFDIWVAHPFALFPTLFWVKTENKQWWGNCPWCSFGIASLTNADTEIFTKLKGQQEPLKIEIRNKEIIQKEYVVHFPIPANKFWDNVIYTCSMMLIFKNENEIDEWCKQHNKAKGEVLPIEQVWKLAQIWYGNYLDPNFKRKTKEIAEKMFEQVGLVSDFWKL
jgi:hypothetical protein